MTAASLPIYLSIWILVGASIGTTLHIRWVFKRHLELQRRVHHLEMERDFPGYTAENRERVHRDQWAGPGHPYVPLPADEDLPPE